MELILNNKGYSGISLLLLLLITLWVLKLTTHEFSTQIVFSVSTLQTVEEIVDQITEEHANSSTGGNRNKPSLREEIEKAKSRLSKNEYKAAKSNYKRMVEHIDKLQKYRQNPLKFDNQGFLKNAPNEEVRQKIIQSRIAHLEKEIQTFYNNIAKIIN